MIGNFQIERVLGRAFTVWFSYPLTFLAIGMMSSLPALAVDLYVMEDMRSVGAGLEAAAISGQLGRYWIDMLLRSAVWLVCACLMGGALTDAFRLRQNGGKPDFMSSILVGFRNFFPMLAIGIIHLLGVVSGLALLLAPGFILMCMWVVVTPERIIEGRGVIACFGCSRALTKGHRGKIFLLILMYYFLDLVIGFALRPLFGVSLYAAGADSLSFGFAVAQWLSQMLFYSFSYILAAAVYYVIKLIKDGLGSEEGLAAFD